MKDLSIIIDPILKRLRLRRPVRIPFERLFELFRQVLAGNNRAIELITDMGETLGGDYLFDITYIRRAYSDLSDAVRSSMQAFLELNQAKYAGIPHIFDRIDDQIAEMITNTGRFKGDYVLFMKDISWDISYAAGGKMAHAAELKNILKLPVPDGFVITVRAFDEMMSLINLQARIDRMPGADNAVEEEAAAIRELIIRSPLPPPVGSAIDAAIDRMRTAYGNDVFLSVRSSAEEEDGDFSFAGQFETILNVPLEREAVIMAYKKVLASLFTEHSISYQRQAGMTPGKLRMAVGCMTMIDPLCSGVIYTSSPTDNKDVIQISASWGVGTAVVDGRVEPDFYEVEKDGTFRISRSKIGAKETIFSNSPDGGIVQAETLSDLRSVPCITDQQIRELSEIAIRTEQYFRHPQDMEWAVDRNGRIFLLQSRPVRIPKADVPASVFLKDITDNCSMTVTDKGLVVQKGCASGRVFLLRHMEDLSLFPKGAVLVSKHDSSSFIRIMPYASAILTDKGSPASHMASLSREFRVPTIVNMKDATSLLRHGQEITVIADEDGNVKICEGIHALPGPELPVGMDEIYELRKKRYVLRHIVPLNLIDPLSDNFSPEGCRTIHDILRFMHEKAVMELVERAQYGRSLVKSHNAVKIDLPVPADIILINIGGALTSPATAGHASPEQVASEPLRAILEGLAHPGVWSSETVSLKTGDFLSSMTRMPDITADNSDLVGYNVAVASREYLHLSIRFGYHFSTIDCYCSDVPRTNHIHFRFAGGATDITKRSRRLSLISVIMKESGFSTNIKGDIIICRISGIAISEMKTNLVLIGRLLSFTRQLDAVLHDEGAVKRYAEKFLSGNYAL